jgi:predicted dehydrogenase
MNICIVGNGNIVKRFLEDVRPITNVKTAALCVREQSREKGAALSEKYRIPLLFTDYAAALERSDIDTVYLGIPNHIHYSYAKQALEAGKNVICEKPFTIRPAETEELIALAEEKEVFLWEACKIPYAQTYQVLREKLPLIGTPRVIHCNYSRKSSRYTDFQKGILHPAFDPEKAGGSLYDINIYNLHLVAALFGAPKAVRYYANRAANGVDISGTAILEYEGFHALCTGSKDSTSPSGVILQGEEGYLRMEGPASSATKIFLSTDGKERCILETPENGKLTEEVREFARQYEEHDMDACRNMLRHSLLVMKIAGQCLERSFCG